jgi:hypothetical protein
MTPSSPLPAPGARLRLGRQRFLALVAVCDARLKLVLGLRLIRVYGWAIALAYAVAMVALSRTSATDLLGNTVLQAVRTLTWFAAAPAAWVAARDLATADEREGVATLLWQHGFTAREVEGGRVAATMWRIAIVAGLPALALAALSVLLSKSTPIATARSLQLIGIATYIAVLAASLGLLARWAALLTPKRGGALLAVVLIAPHLLRVAWPTLPSIPALFDTLLDQLHRAGGRFTWPS